MVNYNLVVAIIIIFTSCHNQKIDSSESDFASESEFVSEIEYAFENLKEEILVDSFLKNPTLERSYDYSQTRSDLKKFLGVKTESKNQIQDSNKKTKHITSQNNSDFINPKEIDHIEHIRRNSNPGQLDGVEHTPKYFVDYTIENLLEKREYKKYIKDRKLLRKLHNKICWNNYVSIIDTLENGDKIEIEIKTQEFDTLNRVLKYHDKNNYLIEIDGKYPYGSVYAKRPKKELESLTIKINGIRLKNAHEKYQNLYEPAFCNFGSHIRITEAFEDGENIYIYIFGGNAANSYFAKLIFDKSDGYITSIIADYVTLSKYGSFGEHFIGF